MTTIYAILADVVVFVHLLYMGYVVFGQLAIMIGWVLRWQWIRNPWFRVSHLAMILIVAGEAMVNFTCPLTTWEADLRELAGQGRNPENPTFTSRVMRKVQFAGADYWPEYIETSYYWAAAIILATALLVPPRFRRKPAPPTAAEPAAPSTAVAPGDPPMRSATPDS